MKRILLALIFIITLIPAEGQMLQAIMGKTDPNTPTDSPGQGSYGSTQSVTLTATNATAIYYTTDGSTPACPSTGTLYSGAFNVTVTTTVKAIGCSGASGGGVLTSVYTITGGSNITEVTVGGGVNDSSVTTVASNAMNCTGANLMVAAVQINGNVTITVADNVNAGNYTSCGRAVANGALEMFYKPSASSAAITVTATMNSATQFNRIMTWCASNANASPADDTPITGTPTTSPVTASVPGATITQSAAGGAIIAAATNDDGSTATFTANNSFTLLYGANGVIQGTTTHDSNMMKLLNSTGAQTPSMSMTALGGQARIVACAFKK